VVQLRDDLCTRLDERGQVRPPEQLFIMIPYCTRGQAGPSRSVADLLEGLRIGIAARNAGAGRRPVSRRDQEHEPLSAKMTSTVAISGG